MKKRSFISGIAAAAALAATGGIYLTTRCPKRYLQLSPSDEDLIRAIKLEKIITQCDNNVYISNDTSIRLIESYSKGNFVNINGFLLPKDWY